MQGYDTESRRSSRSRALERSLSYSEAINSASGRSSIEIPRIANTDVYTNEELKKHYRISQTYVEGKEISFPVINNEERVTSDGLTSQCSSEDDGLVMTIDEDSLKADLKVESSPVDDHDRIEMAELEDTSVELSTPMYSTPYSKRKRWGSRHRRRRGRPARARRVVLKDGEENVPVRSHISSKKMKYLRDIVNTVINSKWRFLILLMIITHFVFWFIFAAIWYAVATSYADDIGDGKEHCVTGTSSFAGLLMMSVETQMTIGYGVRYPNEECPEAIIIMVFEIVAGTALSGGLSSLLFTKLIRPNRHVSSVGFSKRATVCLRDGELCLQFRVWDLANVHMIGSTITAYMLKPIRVLMGLPRSCSASGMFAEARVDCFYTTMRKRGASLVRRLRASSNSILSEFSNRTLEGELVKNYIHQLKLKQARAFLLWPITVVHVINAESPLYDLSAQDCMDYRFEIVVCLQGSSKNMGTVTQSRTSYLSKEISWGHRFMNVLHYSKEDEAYVIDDENLNTVEQVVTPLCSASRLKEFETDIKLSSNLLFTPDTSISPTNLSSQEGTSSKVSYKGSIPSSPSLNRVAGTQRSFGWNFERFYPEKTEAVVEVRRA